MSSVAVCFRLFYNNCFNLIIIILFSLSIFRRVHKLYEIHCNSMGRVCHIQDSMIGHDEFYSLIALLYYY